MQIIVLDYNQLAKVQLEAYDSIQSNSEQNNLTSKGVYSPKLIFKENLPNLFHWHIPVIPSV